MRRMTALGLVVMATLVAAIELAGGPGTGGGGSQLANIYVVAGGGLCAGGRSATEIDYASSASPDRRCGDLETALDEMSAGDTAVIKGGSYTSLPLDVDVTMSPAVTFEVAEGETVEASSLGDVCVTGVTIDGTTGAGGETGSQGIESPDGYGTGCDTQTDNVTIKGVYTSATASGVTPWFFRDCNNVLVQDVTIDGNTGGADAFQLWTGGDLSAATQCDNFTMDRVNIYDFQCPGTNGDHQDAIQMMGGDNFTIRNSKIIGMQCLYVSGPADHGVMGLFLSCGWGTCDGPTIENNLFANVVGDDGAEVAMYYANDAVFVNNTIVDNLGGTAIIKVETGAGEMTDLTFANNVGNVPCSYIDILHGFVDTNGAWANNVLANNCGYGDAQNTGTWNDMFTAPASTLAGSAAGDWTLTSGSFARDKGSATYAPATDWQGGTRGTPPDAGFDEFGAG